MDGPAGLTSAVCRSPHRRSWTPPPRGGRGRYPACVPFLQPETSGRPGSTPGSVDYRFARRQLLHRYRSGELTRADVCDAQSELLRIGTNCSQRATAPCPVCAETQLRIVRFVFGPRMPAGGRVVASRSEMLKVGQASRGGLRCYTVEVCIACRWNHLLQVAPLGVPSDT